LGSQSTAREACISAGVPSAELPSYRTALAALAASNTICERGSS
jgi:mycofactocin biosynthesis protein MftB